MTKNTESQKSKKGKRTGTAVVIVALLIFGVNWVLNQRGQALPDEAVDAAETVIVESFGDDFLESETEPDGVTAVGDPPTPTATSNRADTDEPLWVNADGDFDYYTLALSWQSAFCETASRKPECTSQTKDRFDATHFVLHGLWPNQDNDPSRSFAYCEQPSAVINTDKSGDWCDLPELSLSPTIADELDMTMPGTASCLENHEWYKHGTCAGMSADAYFDLSSELVILFSQTDFNQYIANHIGQQVDRSTLLAQFDTEFGTDNNQYLSLRCTEVGGDSLLGEIRLVLRQDLGQLNDFADLFPTQSAHPDGNCPRQFWIDAVN